MESGKSKSESELAGVLLLVLFHCLESGSRSPSRRLSFPATAAAAGMDCREQEICIRIRSPEREHTGIRILASSSETEARLQIVVVEEIVSSTSQRGSGEREQMTS